MYATNAKNISTL